MTTIADDNTPYKRLVTTAAASIPSAVAGGENLFIDSADNLVKKKNSAGTVAAVGGAASVNSFETIVVSGQSDVVADSATDTLTLVAGSGMTITTNAGTDTITLAASGGAVVQVKQTQSGAVQTGTTVLPYDDTIPTNSEGAEFYTLAITPTSATNLLDIQVVINTSPSVAAFVLCALYQDSTSAALASWVVLNNDTAGIFQIIGNYRMTAGTTSATTFKLRAGLDRAGTITINGVGGARKLGGVYMSSITITEVTP